MYIQKQKLENFSDLDLLDKLTMLEKLLLINITKKNKNKNLKNSNELTNIKLLLEILKFKHKIKSDSKEDNFLNLFNEIYLNTQNNINEVITHE